jgi:hypothetical protein
MSEHLRKWSTRQKQTIKIFHIRFATRKDEDVSKNRFINNENKQFERNFGREGYGKVRPDLPRLTREEGTKRYMAEVFIHLDDAGDKVPWVSPKTSFLKIPSASTAGHGWVDVPDVSS